MRDSLTILAIILILILTAALVGPYFVDWSAQRSFIEARLSQTLGLKAQIHGAIDLKLLPTPYFVVDGLEVGDKAKPVHLSAEKLRLVISIAPLLHGEVDFLEAQLEAPHLDVALPADGSFTIPRPASVSGAHLRFERISIRRGTLSIEDLAKHRSLKLNAIDLDAAGASLFGPYKGSGALDIAGESSAFRFTTGASDRGSFKFNLSVNATASRPRADFDGVASLRDGAPSFAGAAQFESVATTPPWRLNGSLKVDSQRAAMDQLELHVGANDQTVDAAGEASLDFSDAAKASVTLRSGDLDLDRWLGGNAFDPKAAWTSLAGVPPIPLVVTYAAKSLTLHNKSFTNVSANFVLGAPQSAWLRFEARGPGKSRMLLDGQLRRGPDVDFNGKIEASAEDARRLTDWLVTISPEYAPQSLPFHAIDLSADAHVSSAAVALSDLDIQLDGAHFTGKLNYAPATASQPPRFDADLATPSLDLNSLAAIDAPGLLTGSDGSLQLQVNGVTLGDASSGAASIGEVNLKLAKTDHAIELEELTFEGLDGAVLTASGALSESSAHVDAKLAAPAKNKIAALLAKVAPGSLSQAVLSRAGSLAPADLSLTADAAREQDGFAITALSAHGTAGETQIAASIGADPKQNRSLTIAARIDAKDSLSLLRLLALPTASAERLGPGHIDLKAHGSPDQDPDATLSVALGPTNLAFQGRISADLTRFSAIGNLRLSSPDIAPLLRATGLAHPDFTTKLLPAAASGDLTYDKAALALTNFKANLADTTFAGALDYGKSGAKTLTGSIEINRLPAAALFGLALGPPQPAKPGATWASLKFAPVAFDLPAGNVALAIHNMPLPSGLFPAGTTAKNARLTLTSSPGLLDLTGLRLDIADGRATGDVRMRRAGADVSLEGQLQLNDAAVDFPGGRGRLSANLNIAGTGQSADALVSGLAGSGRATVADLTVPHADPMALARVLAASDGDNAALATSDVARALGVELRKGALKAGRRDFDLGVVGGTLHFSPAPADRGPTKPDQPVAVNIAASFDLSRALLNQRVTFVLKAPPKDWSGPAPQINLDLKGPLLNPIAQVDAATFANELAARAIMRETARIESYEFDIHERAFFYHRRLSERRREKERLKAAEDGKDVKAAKETTAPSQTGSTQ